MSDHHQTERRNVDYAEFSTLQKDMTDMKSLMARMVEAMGRITVIEERQHVMAQATSKSLDRIEEITERLHQNEVANALQNSISSRVVQIETVFRELHIENERNKARFDTVVWMVRGLWAIAIPGIGAAVWVIQTLSHLPIPGTK